MITALAVVTIVTVAFMMANIIMSLLKVLYNEVNKNRVVLF